MTMPECFVKLYLSVITLAPGPRKSEITHWTQNLKAWLIIKSIPINNVSKGQEQANKFSGIVAPLWNSGPINEDHNVKSFVSLPYSRIQPSHSSISIPHLHWTVDIILFMVVPDGQTQQHRGPVIVPKSSCLRLVVIFPDTQHSFELNAWI